MANGKVVINIDGDNSQFIQQLKAIGTSSDQIANELAREFEKAGLSASEAMKKANVQIAQYNEQMMQSSIQSFDNFANKAGISIAAVATAMIALEKTTREQRDEVNKLTTAYEDSGKTATQATDTYKDLYGVMGESDSAVEAAQQLAVLTNNQQELSEWTDIAAGVYAKFDDALKLETLAEGANVTATLGKATGGMVDALEFAGITVDEFDANLANMVTQEERAEYVTKVLSDTYSDLGDTYRQNNKEVIEAREAELELSLAMAELGAAISPVVTELMGLGADILPILTDAFEENKEIILAAAAALLAGAVAAKGFAVVSTIVNTVKAWTTATTAQTIAQNGLNVAMNANPIGLAITGISALIAGIVTFIGVTDNESEAVKEAREELEASNEAMEKLAQSTKETVAQTQGNAATAKLLTDRLKNLESQGLKTASAQADYASTVDALNDLMPDLNLQIDESTGLLETNTEAIYAQVDALAEQAEGQAYYDQMTIAIQELAAAEAERAMSQAEYDAMEAENVALLERKDEVLALLSERQKLTTEEITALTAEEASLNEQLSENSGRFVELYDIMALQDEGLLTLETSVNSATTAYDGYKTSLEETAAQNQATADSYNAIIAKQDALEIELEELQIAYKEAYDSAYSNISQTLGLFNTMETTVGQSVEGMIGSLDSQIAFMDTYAENLVKAAELGVDEGLISKLSDGSTESAEILQGIVDDGGENISELNEKFAKVEEGKEAFSNQVAKMATDFDSKMASIESSLQNMVDEMNQSSKATTNTNETISAIVNTAYAGQSRVASAYRALANSANYAYRSTLDINSPSRVFEKNTGYTTEAIEKQVKKDTPGVEKAYSELASATVTGFNAGQTALNVFGANAVNNATARSLGSNSQSISKTINSTNSEIVVKSDIYLNDEKIGEAVSPTVNKELASYEDYEERGSL